jgi:hypothetical protein
MPIDSLCRNTPAIMVFSLSLPASFSTIEESIIASDKLLKGESGFLINHKSAAN